MFADPAAIREWLAVWAALSAIYVAIRVRH